MAEVTASVAEGGSGRVALPDAESCERTSSRYRTVGDISQMAISEISSAAPDMHSFDQAPTFTTNTSPRGGAQKEEGTDRFALQPDEMDPDMHNMERRSHIASGYEKAAEVAHRFSQRRQRREDQLVERGFRRGSSHMAGLAREVIHTIKERKRLASLRDWYQIKGLAPEPDATWKIETGGCLPHSMTCRTAWCVCHSTVPRTTSYRNATTLLNPASLTSPTSPEHAPNKPHYPHYPHYPTTILACADTGRPALSLRYRHHCASIHDPRTVDSAAAARWLLDVWRRRRCCRRRLDGS